MHLLLKITFATKRYHGKSQDDNIEYPPSPSRVFQALIAGSHSGIYGLINTEYRDTALRWLESLPPPLIKYAHTVESGHNLTNYVPNNDNDINHGKTAKSVVSRWFLDDATIAYQWEFIGNEENIGNAKIVCAIAGLLTHLGQHEDLVFAEAKVLDQPESWPTALTLAPLVSENGDWTSPKPGSLNAYQKRYQAWLKGVPKENIPIPLHRLHYDCRDTIRFFPKTATFMLMSCSPESNDASSLSDEPLPAVAPENLRVPASMVRHAMINWLQARPRFIEYYGAERTSQLIAGHQGNDCYKGEHFACIPLPSMNESGHADGYIRRVMVVGFGCTSPKDVELFDSVTDGLNGAQLIDQGKTVGYLRRTFDERVTRMFQTETPHRVWRTASPIVFTGLMKRGRTPEDLILRTLRQIGIDHTDVESIAAFSSPIVPKTLRARQYHVADYLAQTPRYHAEIIFRRPVAGLLVAGRGRHSGFGLMMPWST